MINDVYSSIAEECRAVSPETQVYRDHIPQNFTVPAFFVELKGFDPVRSINGKQRVSAQFDLQYFPDGEPEEYITKCVGMQEELARHFHVLPGSFYVKNRSGKVTDNVLHFQFTVSYTQAVEAEGTSMRELKTNTNLKEA